MPSTTWQDLLHVEIEEKRVELARLEHLVQLADIKGNGRSVGTIVKSPTGAKRRRKRARRPSEELDTNAHRFVAFLKAKKHKGAMAGEINKHIDGKIVGIGKFVEDRTDVKLLASGPAKRPTYHHPDFQPKV